MIIRLTESGGFVGLRRRTRVIDTAGLPQPQRQSVEALVRSQEFAALHSQRHDRPGAADTLAYELVVEDGAARHVLTFGDATTPKALIPILEMFDHL